MQSDQSLLRVFCVVPGIQDLTLPLEILCLVLQLRNLVWATSKHDVYFLSHFSVTHWSALTCKKIEVLNVSGHVAPCEKHPGSLMEGFTQTKGSTLAVKDRLLVAGGFQVELICKTEVWFPCMINFSKYIQVIGWSMWFSEYLFLERSWAKDETTLKVWLCSMIRSTTAKRLPSAILVGTFCRRYSFYAGKAFSSSRVAASTGLPVPRNVLIPRTKGIMVLPTTPLPFPNRDRGAVYFTAANNDCGVRDFDMETFQLSLASESKGVSKTTLEPSLFILSSGVGVGILALLGSCLYLASLLLIMHTSMSPDGKLRIIVGDNPEGMLVDSRTGKHHGTLMTSPLLLGIDARNLSKSVAALKGNLGAIQSIRYSSDGRFMAMAEPADFVYAFDAESGYEKEQEIDFFGEISSMSFSPDTESLFIGVHVHVKRHLMKELPESDDDVAKWCRDIFVAKDNLLDKHNAEDTFGDQEQDASRRMKSIVVLIQFSQSERSTPAKVVPAKPKNQGEPSGTPQVKPQ
ncbi:hypothetical protein C3L33_02061, partial [Rhododendron williamsianum]